MQAVDKANKKHDNRYDYSLVEYVKNSVKVKITCPEHGEFKQIPNSHLRGNGCPKCNNNLTSFREQVIFYYLSKLRFKVESCKKIDSVELDIYIPHLKLGIEYDGEYYHRDKAEKDLTKNNFFKERVLILFEYVK